MINNYLKEEKELCLKNRNEFEEKYASNSLTILELIEKISILEDEEKNSDDFLYPRDKGNELHEKLINLKNMKLKLESENVDITNMISYIDNRIVQLDSLLKGIKKEKSEQRKKDKENNANMHIKMLEAQEFERQRIARDLHDSTVQNLTNCVHKLEYISKIIDTDPERSKMELIMLEKNTRTVINEMREIIYNLRPMSFEDIGIDVTIERELVRLENIGNIKINYTVKGKPDSIKPVICLTIFRIVQEACNNAIKHSNATCIDVELNYNKKNIELLISDNGLGFDIEACENNSEDINSGFGLSMMKERVFLLSGKFSIDTSKNKGTKIKVVVPIK